MSNKPYHSDLCRRLQAAVVEAGIELTSRHLEALFSNGQFTSDGASIFYDYPANRGVGYEYMITIHLPSNQVEVRGYMASQPKRYTFSAERFNEWMRRNG